MKGMVWGEQYERCGMGVSNMKGEVWGSAV